MTKYKADSIIKVQFVLPMNGSTEHYFGSLAAIYDEFTPEEIGCRLEALWSFGITYDKPKLTRKCLITKHPVHRKAHKK